MIPPMETKLIRRELESVRDILDKWISACDQGLPCADTPGTEDVYSEHVRGMCGELLLATGKIHSILDVFNSV